MKNEQKKMTLEEYQKKHAKPYNKKIMKVILFTACCILALIIIYCLFSLVLKIYEMFDKNVVSLYIGIPIALVVFTLIYIIPLVKIQRARVFETQNVTSRNIKEVRKQNKKLRESLADGIIDLQANTADVDWYKEETVGKLAIARHTHNDEELRKALSEIYNTDIKKSSRNIIFKEALQVGITTALSQNEKIDTLLSLTVNMSLIKKLVYLYGFRPNDRQMINIYQTVIVSALAAYGAGSSASKITGKLLSNVPLVGLLVEAVSQGLVNATFTAIVGFQTRKYLRKEFHLQDVLEDVTFDEDNIQDMASTIKDRLVETIKEKEPKKAKAS